MQKIIVKTEGAPKAIGPYSQAIVAGNWVYCSGQIPLDPATGRMIDGGVGEQTRRVLENLKAVVESAGATFHDVVKCTVYLTDLGSFQAMNEVYATYLGEFPPARATVEVAALPKGALVEIDCVAWLET